MSNTFNIKNTKAFLLDNDKLAYKIEKGKANLYIAEFIVGKPVFRLFIKCLKANDIIPGFDKTLETGQFKLFLINSSRDSKGEIDNLVISTQKNSEELRKTFLENTNIFQLENSYEDNLVHHYLMEKVKESRNVYSEYITNIEAREGAYKRIKKILADGDGTNNNEEKLTGDLYFALAKVCNYMNISFIPYYKLNNDQRNSLSVETFCKYSSCSFKPQTLQDKWYKKDSGNFIAYKKKDNMPVACIFKNNSYYVASKDSENFVKVNKNVADSLKEESYVLFKTFPERALDYKDIIRHIYYSIPIERIFNIVIIAVVLSVFGMLTPSFTRLIYNHLIPNNDYAGIFGCGSVLFAMILGTALLSIVKGFSVFSLSAKIKYSLQIAFFDRVFKIKQSFIKKYEPANLAMIIFGVGTIFTNLSTTTVANFLAFVFSFFYLFQMFSFMPSLCLPAVFMLIVVFLLLICFAKIQYKWYQETVELDLDKSSWLFQIIRGIDKLRISASEDRAVKKYIDIYSQVANLTYKTGYYTNLINIISTMFSSVLMIVFYYIIYDEGLYASVGDLTGFLSAYALFSTAVLGLPNIYSSYLKSKPWFERLKPIISQMPEKYLSSFSNKKIDGSIDIMHLSFGYENSDSLVLDDVSFKVRNGEYLGIVGESGCGKTTLLNLLLGFEKPNKGKIYYGNYDIADLNKIDLRQQIGVVLQDGGLISGSIADNILITNPNSTLKDLNEVLDKVGLLDDVEKMPMGVHTILSEGSGQISGGQKQRVLIARAIMGNPKIIFFDEATSALDNITQSHICDNLAKIGCTRVVIAHRLSTVIDCDRILVFSNGKIVEEGNYKSLMKEKGLFYKFAKRQIV